MMLDLDSFGFLCTSTIYMLVYIAVSPPILLWIMDNTLRIKVARFGCDFHIRSHTDERTTNRQRTQRRLKWFLAVNNNMYLYIYLSIRLPVFRFALPVYLFLCPEGSNCDSDHLLFVVVVVVGHRYIIAFEILDMMYLGFLNNG